jgi:hypothetical protein
MVTTARYKWVVHPEHGIDEPTKPALVCSNGLQQQSGTSVDINMATSSVHTGRKLGTTISVVTSQPCRPVGFERVLPRTLHARVQPVKGNINSLHTALRGKTMGNNNDPTWRNWAPVTFDAITESLHFHYKESIFFSNQRRITSEST